MADPRGTLTLTAGGKEYRLHIGMSVLADLQAKHGLDVMQQLEAPPGAGPQWLPDMGIVVDMFLAALARYHATRLIGGWSMTCWPRTPTPSAR
jgi:hypothetical protein